MPQFKHKTHKFRFGLLLLFLHEYLTVDVFQSMHWFLFLNALLHARNEQQIQIFLTRIIPNTLICNYSISSVPNASLDSQANQIRPKSKIELVIFFLFVLFVTSNSCLTRGIYELTGQLWKQLWKSISISISKNKKVFPVCLDLNWAHWIWAIWI